MTALLFWLSCALILYTYLGYPLWLWCLRRLAPRPVLAAPWQPLVSVVLAACNEAGNIERRIANLLGQHYPAGKLEIVLVSDGSTDGTVELARALGSEALSVLALTERRGKAAALNAGVQRARGEILVFCDARQQFQPEVINVLVAQLADTAVGCVSGELMLVRGAGEGTGIQVEMGAYWSYEKWVRKAESASGSCIGATGAIYAVRRELYRELPAGLLLDDVLNPMQIVMQGYRCVFAPQARAEDQVSQEVSQEWKRKVRTLAGNWQLLSLRPALLLPWANPCWWRFVSHKVLRLLVPFALVLLLAAGAALPGATYRAATALQLLCYGAAALAWLFPQLRAWRLLNICYFFVVMNAATVAGFWRWLTGRCATTWQPAYSNGAE